MKTALPYELHSIAEAMTAITQGEDSWVALNAFFHDWWCYGVDYRKELIEESVYVPGTLEGKRWAACCATAVEELCSRTSFPCPEWVFGQAYVLDQPWFSSGQHKQLMVTALGPFRRRNVFMSSAVLDNKYELKQLFGDEQKRTYWSEQELQALFNAQ